ncbi:TPR domain protein [Talaromyces stipitatus ATCC 10500]|uniref:TPR domain protein n=1 Tax=Talaromyces stipitatus (strain ATCC 10500 / CBS 375.48 / QM 6759 / NRRL 1006) TaxID=441959 RepID=B8MIS9_TALSN|nr:TPR domain protein [Talaromyces stipitatus ATCC 10500]EED15591.1 TPR domain protein [Talaromyces stipitatus ATCC 10500]
MAQDSPISSTKPAQFTTIYDDDTTKRNFDPIRIRTSDRLLHDPLAQELLNITSENSSPETEALSEGKTSYTNYVAEKVRKHVAESASKDANAQHELLSQILHIGFAALFCFLQSNVTGPPLEFNSAVVVFGETVAGDKGTLNTVRRKMLRDLSIDGEAVYPLTPNIELFCVAKAILVESGVFVADNSPLVARTGRMRVNFLHQKMLSEVSGTLQKAIYDDLDVISATVLGENSDSIGKMKAAFLLERAAVHTHHGLDAKARSDLDRAASASGFEYALTGKLGKRTKFQDRDITQLVVLAVSSEMESMSEATEAKSEPETSGPKALDLNDDTLLETIAFAKEGAQPEKPTTVQDESSLPPALVAIDPSNQPKLNPLDSAILLAIASAITNNSPEHGLTREETLPYATRVIESGSNNWQIYTQALLVRSRCEAFKARTVERGVLQMQALVDQVIADTATSNTAMVTTDTVSNKQQEQPTTFLPRPEESESAPAEERLEYLWTLHFKTRWNLEAELAQKWVSLGGLRTALDIYERLEMWAEVALCYAATEREEKAKAIVRRQLYEPTNPGTIHDDNERYEGSELPELPADAPRLFCILGDIDSEPAMYERAWEVSGQRYARAQRSLARLYLKAQPPDYEKAEEAYKKSLRINLLNHGAWFALGCVQLNRQKWHEAVEAFTRTVQLEQDDAEAWSNLAAALLHVSPGNNKPSAKEQKDTEVVEGEKAEEETDPYKHTRDALTALHHAARLKQTDHRIWDNIVTVAASLPPLLIPYKDIVFALRKVIELRSPKRGEKAIDLTVLDMLVEHLINDYKYDDLLITVDGTNQKILRTGTVAGQIITLIDDVVVPLITRSAPLWLLVAKVELWRQRPSKAFAAHEKAWRATISSCTQGAFQMGDEKKWIQIVKATERLVRDGYAKIGGMTKEREDGAIPEGEGEEELVAKDWRFKSRSAVRGILGKGKDWEGTEGWTQLKELLSEVDG